MNFGMSPEAEAFRDLFSRAMESKLVAVIEDFEKGGEFPRELKILIAEDVLDYNLADRHDGKTGLRDVRKDEVTLAATGARA